VLTVDFRQAMEKPADAHAAFRGGRHFGSLDGLRALSVIAVIWHHTIGREANLPALFAHGAHGVTLFFAISGFLIVTLLLRERDRVGHIDLGAFYMRRSLRIFPLYYAVLTIYVLLVLIVERNSLVGAEFFRNLPFFATYTSNWFVPLDGRVIFYFAWSLAAEEQFYLMWPWMEKYLKPLRALALVGMITVLMAALQTFGVFETGKQAPWWHRMVINFPLAICFGVVLAHLLHHERSFRWMRWVFGWRASSAVFVLVALAVLAWGESSPLPIPFSLALLVGACVYREDHLLAPLLRARPLVFIGSVSYGIYLLHMLTKGALTKGLPFLGLPESKYLLFVLTMLGSIGVAAFSFRRFESFFLKMKERYVVTTDLGALGSIEQQTPQIGGANNRNVG
jgi:peptidoglycan/LPS O-acetylase OafA/YrhL